MLKLSALKEGKNRILSLTDFVTLNMGDPVFGASAVALKKAAQSNTVKFSIAKALQGMNPKQRNQIEAFRIASQQGLKAPDGATKIALTKQMQAAKKDAIIQEKLLKSKNLLTQGNMLQQSLQNQIGEQE